MHTFWLHPAELFVARIVTVLIALDAVLIGLRGSSVDVTAYARIALIVGVFLCLGFFYRRSGRSEAIGAMGICTSLFIALTAALSLFNYLLTPNPHPLIDPWLQAVDSALGYRWPEAIAWAARHPVFNETMRLAYMTTLPQIAVLVAVLGLANRLEDLYSLIVTVTITGMIAVMFWGLFPSAGAKSFHHISTALLHAVRPVVDPAYGAEILALVKNGAPHLSPDEFRGLIAFPSFHIVLAVAATWHARHVNWLFWPYLVVNLIVLPAVLVHGGHHLVDIPAGMAVFAFGLWCARLVLYPAVTRTALSVA